MRAYTDVQLCELQIQAIRFARSGQERYVHDNISEAAEILISDIYARKARAYEKLFMFGTVSSNPKLIKAARFIAYRKLLNDTSDTSRLLDHEIQYNGSKQAKLRTELHQLAKSQGLRLAQMSKSSLLVDIHSLKSKLAATQKENEKLTNSLKVIHVLRP
jgi:hypothetical protein